MPTPRRWPTRWPSVAGAAEAAEVLEPGASAVAIPPLAVAETLPEAAVPPGPEHAVVTARTIRAPQPAAASLAPERVRAMAVRTPMKPPGTGAP